VAQVLEEEAGSLDERAAEIAQHWEEAEERGRAARWHARAADWAGRSDPREGLRHWRRVRDLARDLSDESERRALGLRACEQILAFGWRMGGGKAEVAEVYEEGRALAEQRGDRRELALLVGRFSQVLINLGDVQDGVRHAEEAARLAQLCDDPALRAVGATFPAFGYATSGDNRALVDWAERGLAEIGADDSLGREITGYSPRLSMLHIRAVALANLGRLAEAEHELRKVERAAEAERDLEILSWLGLGRASIVYLRGTREPALEGAHRSVAIAEQIDLDSSRIIALAGLGLAHWVEGRAEDAREALLASAAIGRDRLFLASMRVQVLAHLAEVHLALGERDRALSSAREAISVGRESGGRFFEAHAELNVARILLAMEGDLARAEIEAALDRAEARIESTGTRSLSPHLLELRARLSAALGDAAAAARGLGQALDVYREIGATGHADRLSRELEG
jgi:tetratricopeptide (TPR) repeat protein